MAFKSMTNQLNTFLFSFSKLAVENKMNCNSYDFEE